MSTRWIAVFAAPFALVGSAARADDVASYSRSVIARPLTLPAEVVAIGADTGGNHDLSAITAAPIVGYGITDKFELQVPYSFAVHDLEARGSVAVDAGYVLERGALGGKLEAIVRARAGYDTFAGAATPLGIGVHVQYNPTPWLAVISGTPGNEQLRVSLASNAQMEKPVDVSIPIALGVQPTQTLYLQLDTKLAQLALAESHTLVIGRDMMPLALTAVWNAWPAVDLQCAIATDLVNAPMTALSFLVGARVYAGRL